MGRPPHAVIRGRHALAVAAVGAVAVVAAAGASWSAPAVRRRTRRQQKRMKEQHEWKPSWGRLRGSALVAAPALHLMEIRGIILISIALLFVYRR